MADVSKPRAKQPSSPAKTAYLVLYNFASAVAWSVVLGRAVSVCAVRGPQFVPFAVGEWTRWTQTMAGMEVLHSLLGMPCEPVLRALSTPRLTSCPV